MQHLRFAAILGHSSVCSTGLPLGALLLQVQALLADARTAAQPRHILVHAQHLQRGGQC